MNEVTVILKRDKECKGSVRFSTSDEKAPLTNVYLSRAVKGCNEATEITVTVKLGN